MKTSSILKVTGIFFIIFMSFNLTSLFSQTDGILTFTYTQTAPSASATKNVMAVWIEDSLGNFIKTKMRYWSNSTNDHLPSWVSKSAQNVTDATTGATRTVGTNPTAFGSKTVTWDGKNASGVLVPDGKYVVYVESSYCNPEPANGQHWIITNFSFTKGPNADHVTPSGPANFSNISLDWIPNTTSVEKINSTDVKVFPNPSTGIIKVEYKNAGLIKIENASGKTIFEEKVNSNSGVKSFDLKNYSNGIYFVKIQNKYTNEFQKYKVILDK